MVSPPERRPPNSGAWEQRIQMTQANLNTTLLWRQEPEGMASAIPTVNGANSTALLRRAGKAQEGCRPGSAQAFINIHC